MASHRPGVRPSTSLEALSSRWQRGGLATISANLLIDEPAPTAIARHLLEHEGHDGVLLERRDPSTGRLLSATISFDPWATLTSQGGTLKWKGWIPEGSFGLPSDADALAQLERAVTWCGTDDVPSVSAAGYVGYDATRAFHGLPPQSIADSSAPDLVMLFPRVTLQLAVDGGASSVHVHCPIGELADASAAYQSAVQRIEQLAANLGELSVAAPMPLPRKLTADDPFPATSTVGTARFRSMLQRAIDAVEAHEVTQIVPSQRFSMPFDGSAIDVLRALHHLNPSPYQYVLRHGTTWVVGASPQTAVRCEPDGGSRAVTIRPIGGTRPRSQDDEAVVRELLADRKELDELELLVDLAVDDLQELVEPGSLHVDPTPTVRTYSHLFHLTKDVRGTLRPSISTVRALLAHCPVGTVSGTPRSAAMQLLDDIEEQPRGLYGGNLAWFGTDGSLDSCIAIRTAVIHDGCAWSQAGAGVVAGSRIAAEEDESENKARAIFSALLAAAPRD